MGLAHGKPTFSYHSIFHLFCGKKSQTLKWDWATGNRKSSRCRSPEHNAHKSGSKTFILYTFQILQKLGTYGRCKVKNI